MRIRLQEKLLVVENKDGVASLSIIWLTNTGIEAFRDDKEYKL